MGQPLYFLGLIIASAALFIIGPLAPLVSSRTAKRLHSVLGIGAVLAFIYAAAIALGFHPSIILPGGAFVDSLSAWHLTTFGLAALFLSIVGRGAAIRYNDPSPSPLFSLPLRQALKRTLALAIRLSGGQNTPQNLTPATEKQPMMATAGALGGSHMNQEAVRELRIAVNYLDELSEDVPNERIVARHKILSTISAATKHLDRARTIDPDCFIEVPVPDGEGTLKTTVDHVCGRALWWEGFALNRFDDDKGSAKQAVKALQQAVAYNDFPSYHTELARALQRLGNRKQADVHIKRALELDPDDMEAHKMADGMLGGPPIDRSSGFPLFELSFMNIVALIGVGLFVGGIIALANGKGSDGVGMIVLALGCGGLLTLGEKLGF
jgi:hypothetical protein